MTGNNYRLFLCICLTLITMLSAGCFQVKSDIVIHEDGSANFNLSMIGNEFMQEEIEKTKQDLLKNSSSKKIENMSQGNMKGFRTSSDYHNIRSLAQDNHLFDAHMGIDNGIQMKKGLLFDSYSLDLLFENNDGNKNFKDLSSDEQAMAKSMMSDIKFDFTLNLPYASESNNASNVTNDGKTLYWDLSGALLGNETVPIKANFRIWHKERVIALGVVGVILLLAILSFLSKAKTAAENGADPAKAKNSAILCIMLLLILAGGTYYLMEEKPKFTEQDIISNIADKQTSSASSSAVSTGNNNTHNNVTKNSAAQTNVKAAQNKSSAQSQSQYQSQSESRSVSGSQTLALSARPNSETAVGPVDLNVSFDQILLFGNLGQEEKPSKLDSDGFTHYYYPDLEILVANGHVESIYSNSSQVQTKRGVRQGDSVQDVLQKYGEPYGKTAYNGSTLYEYQFRSSNNDNCLLRFAVKNGVVDYIGSRIIR